MYYKIFRKRCHWKNSYCGSDKGAVCVWWCLWRDFFFDRKFNYRFATLDHISIRERSTMGKHICDNQHYEHTEKSFLWNLSSHSSANRKLRTWLCRSHGNQCRWVQNLLLQGFENYDFVRFQSKFKLLKKPHHCCIWQTCTTTTHLEIFQ